MPLTSRLTAKHKAQPVHGGSKWGINVIHGRGPGVGNIYVDSKPPTLLPNVQIFGPRMITTPGGFEVLRNPECMSLFDRPTLCVCDIQSVVLASVCALPVFTFAPLFSPPFLRQGLSTVAPPIVNLLGVTNSVRGSLVRNLSVFYDQIQVRIV